MKRTQQLQIRGQTIDKIMTETNLTLPYQTVPGENRNLKLGIVLTRGVARLTISGG